MAHPIDHPWSAFNGQSRPDIVNLIIRQAKFRGQASTSRKIVIQEHECQLRINLEKSHWANSQPRGIVCFTGSQQVTNFVRPFTDLNLKQNTCNYVMKMQIITFFFISNAASSQTLLSTAGNRMHDDLNAHKAVELRETSVLMHSWMIMAVCKTATTGLLETTFSLKGPIYARAYLDFQQTLNHPPSTTRQNTAFFHVRVRAYMHAWVFSKLATAGLFSPPFLWKILKKKLC